MSVLFGDGFWLANKPLMHSDGLRLDKLIVFQEAMHLGESVWKATESWDWRIRKSLGDQLTRAADSVAANISEGYGRQNARVNRQFCYYARGSLNETRTWLKKAYNRNLIDKTTYGVLFSSVSKTTRLLNAYINSLNKRISHTPNPNP